MVSKKSEVVVEAIGGPSYKASTGSSRSLRQKVDEMWALRCLFKNGIFLFYFCSFHMTNIAQIL